VLVADVAAVVVEPPTPMTICIPSERESLLTSVRCPSVNPIRTRIRFSFFDASST
jgi:hypothetical protein